MGLKFASAILAFAVAITPALAFGGTAWYDGSDPGDNYSWDVNFDDQSVRIHDGECDGDGAYSHYYTTTDQGTQRRVDDPDGCSSGEGTASSLFYLYRHRTCEDCLLYTSDAADDLLCVDLGGRRIIKKKKQTKKTEEKTKHRPTTHIH